MSRYERQRSAFLIALVFTVPVAASATLRNSPHNLSPGGPGRARVTGEQSAAAEKDRRRTNQMCIYCHTPHNATAKQGLWNRELAAITYKLYESSTTEAELQQPTGASRLCLSCHDGVIALGALKHKPDPKLGKLTGQTVLGTDLSDDHPISFIYDSALATRRPGLADPETLTGAVRLDNTAQLQCTSCHDPHNDKYTNFVVTDLADSRLCVTCHVIPGWQKSAHATSVVAADTEANLPGWGFGTVGANGCSSCHQTHGAEHPVRLLRGQTEEESCLSCHDGTVAEKNIAEEVQKLSAHRVDVYLDIHDPTEEPFVMRPHVECVDCHHPHQATKASSDNGLSGPLKGVSGVDVGGRSLLRAQEDYEICLKCHGVAENPSSIVQRADNVTNVRLEIQPQNVSYHPIAEIGRNSEILGLLSPLTPASRIGCQDCHGSEAAFLQGNSAPRGPHGSIYEPILNDEYRLFGDVGPESYQLYALCYRCHNRDVLLNENIGGFSHRLHLSEVGTGCAVCHDAHGSRDNTHLINFMTLDPSGVPVVSASAAPEAPPEPAFESFGNRSGQCFLTCHGSDHGPKDYP